MAMPSSHKGSSASALSLLKYSPANLVLVIPFPSLPISMSQAWKVALTSQRLPHAGTDSQAEQVTLHLSLPCFIPSSKFPKETKSSLFSLYVSTAGS